MRACSEPCCFIISEFAAIGGRGGDRIGCIVIIEFADRNDPIFDDILQVIKKHSDYKVMSFDYAPLISISDLQLFPERRKVYHNNHEIDLTVKEYDLFYLLVQNKGKVITYDEIYRKVWGDDAFNTTNNNIACHISSLRKKLCRILPQGSLLIRCIQTVGYILEENK